MDFTLGRVQSEVMFFSAFCQEARKDVLLGPERVADLRHGPLGFELHYSCYCGRLGVVYPNSDSRGLCGEPVLC